MALINGIYMFVEAEDLSRSVNVPEHSVESGVNLTDHVKPNQIVLSVSGEIVNCEDGSASEILAQFAEMQRTGTLVNYIGRTTMNNALITDIQQRHTNEIAGGAAVTMTLKQIRIASSPYSPDRDPFLSSTAQAGTQQPATNTSTSSNTSSSSSSKKKVYHKVKKGETFTSIARKYKSKGCTVSKIKRQNPKVVPERMAIGTRLWVYSK